MSFKKVSSSILSFGLLLGAVSPAFAEGENNTIQVEQNTEQQETLYNYEYNGIEFSGNYELSEAELQQMYRETINRGPSSIISPRTPDPGSSTVTVVPPIYKTYSNKTTRIVADGITVYLVSKAPKKVQQAALGAWILGKLESWSDSIKPTYVGAWTSSAWSNYYNERRYYDTVVHYAKSNYTNPQTVQYWDATAMWK